MLGSLDDIDIFLFGEGGGYTQNLYQTDFDDPTRTNEFDFNVFKDDALPNEGNTAGGDSGGPLILDQTFDQKVVLGVLSGGSRYFLEQPQSSYGGSAFYQPLYLFWDWIAQNNPYRYATAKAGDGKWSDASHWVTALDPNYMIIDSNGSLVNGVPTTPGAGAFGEDDAQKFGQVCYQPNDGSDDACYDVGTDTLLINGEPVEATDATTTSGSKTVANNKGKVEIAERSPSDGAASLADEAIVEAEAEGDAVLPAATLANGLPGATNFVPNNIDPVAAQGVVGRYYDVTLSAAGKTTLDIDATVDRFTISGTGSTLDVTSAGSLTSLMDINHLAGVVNVDGAIETPGDYLLLSGLLSGKGTLRTPYFTNIMGVVAPGPADDDVEGVAAVDGKVVFGAATGAKLRYGSRYTFLTAEGGVEGTFDAPTNISAILKPVLSYGANSVSVTIDAGTYAGVVNGGSQVQTSFARLLDQNRALYGNYATLYGEADLLSVAAIQASLEAMAPRTEALRTSMSEVLNDNTARFYRDRLARVSGGSMGGTLTMTGQPLQLAALSMNNLNLGMDQGGGNETVTQENALPEDVSAFIAGGYIDGKSDPMRGAITTGRDKFDGWYGAAGIEKMIGDDAVIGLAASFSELKGNTGIGDTARARLYQATVYGNWDLGGIVLDGVGSAGTLTSKTKRAFAVGTTPYTLRGSDQQLALSGEIGIGAPLGGDAFTITPRASLRGAYISGGNLAEYGGDTALVIQHHAIQSAQGRLGATARIDVGGFKPYLAANYVHEFRDQPAYFLANFVGGTGSLAPFALGGSDKNWGEVGGGLTLSTGNVDISLSADTTAWRGNLSYQSYRAALKFRF